MNKIDRETNRMNKIDRETDIQTDIKTDRYIIQYLPNKILLTFILVQEIILSIM